MINATICKRTSVILPVNSPIDQRDPITFLCFVVFSGVMERQDTYLSLLSVLGCILGKSNNLSTLTALVKRQALDRLVNSNPESTSC